MNKLYNTQEKITNEIRLSFVFLRKFLSIFYKVKFLLKFSLILPIILTFKHANAEHL